MDKTLQILESTKAILINIYESLKKEEIFDKLEVRMSLTEYSLLKTINNLSVAIEDLTDENT